jgi:small-conductance mechanosensitive channel
MDFNLNSGLHIISILATTLLIIFITKIIFAVFPVATDRRKVINSFCILVFFVILNYVNIFKHFPWFNTKEYYNALKVAIALFSTMLFTSSLDYFVWNGIAKRTNKPGVPKILTNILKFIIYFVILILCANQIYGMQITTLLASAGLLTFILGYASKATLSNFFAGIAVQLGGKLKKGHHITAGKHEGVIIEFNWRSTTIKGAKTMVIPNSQISNDDIIVHNYGLNEPYAATLTLPIPSYADHSDMLKLATETIKECSPIGQGLVSILNAKSTNLELIVIGMVQNRTQIWPMKTEFHSAIESKSNKGNLYIGAPKDITWIQVKEPYQIQQPSQETIINAVKNSANFSGLSEKEIKDLIEPCSIEHFTCGENVFNQNMSGDSMFIVINGEFTTNENHKGVRKEMRTLCKPDAFGLKTFLLSEPRRITVRCKSIDGWTLEIKRGDFNNIQELHPRILDDLSAILIQREQENHKKHHSIDEQESQNEEISKIILNKIANLFHKKK